jgi:ribosome-associated protein
MLDLRELAWFADYFVIMSAQSTRQLFALEEDITKALKAVDVPRFHREGTSTSSWLLLDFSGVIVHLFDPKTRDMYGLERLWSSATEVVRIL